MNNRSLLRCAALSFSCLLFVACSDGGSNDGEGGAGGKAGGHAGSGGKAGGTAGHAGSSAAGSGGGSVAGSGGGSVAGSGGGSVAGSGGGSTAGAGGGSTAGAGGGSTAGAGGGSAGRGGASAGAGGGSAAGAGGGAVAGKGGGSAAGAGGSAAGAGGSAAGAGGSAAGAGGSTAGAGGAPVAGAGGGAAGAGGGVACNTLTNSAASHVEQIVAQDLPAMSTFTGGQIQTGTYYRTSTDRYLGPAASPGPDSTYKETLTVANNGGTTTVQVVVSNLSEGTIDERSTFTASVSGVALTLTRTCPATGGESNFYYTYESNTGTLSILDLESGRLQKYARQTGQP